MLGNNESARVSASRVLMDALAEPERDKDEDREADMQRANARAKARLAELLASGARPTEATERLDAEAVAAHPEVVVGDISPERAAATLAGLEEVGLIAPVSRVKDLAEERAAELLRALREEHGIPA
jgi:hypothetical protein